MVKKSQSDRLRVSHSMLSDEFNRMNESAISAQTLTDSLKQTQSVYQSYGDKIGLSKKLVGLIENYEMREELIFKTSVYLFFGSAIYLFLKRFYLNEIVQMAIYLLYDVVFSGIIRPILSTRIGPSEAYLMI